MLKRMGTPRVELKVKQMTSKKEFDTYCKEFDGICFLAFFPHIYDTTAEERNTYIELLKSLYE